MRSYLSASRFPSVNIGGVSVPRLILGHMPFVGESYQGAEKNREYRIRFLRVENTVELLRKAVEEYGVTVTAAMSSVDRLSTLLLEAVRTAIRQTGVEIALIPCFKIPLIIDGRAIDDYRRWVTYYHIERRVVGEQILERYVNDPVLLCREGWRERFPKAISQLRPYGDEEIKNLQVNYEELEEAMARLDGFNVILAEPGSESDFLAMIGRTDLLKDLVERLRDRFDCPVVAGVHHAGSTMPILETSDADLAGYVTPVNRLGVLMLPTFKLALEAVKNSKRPIIAIKPLAGGRIAPEEALRYVYREGRVQACMVGVASRGEMDQDFCAGKKFLGE